MLTNKENGSWVGSFNPNPSGVMTQMAWKGSNGAEVIRIRLPLERLVERLLRDHRRWLHVDLPTIDYLLQRIVDEYGGDPPALVPQLRRSLHCLRHEIEKHSSNQEYVIFPAILDLERAVLNGLPRPRPKFGSLRNPISMMERDLESHEHRLDEIARLVHEHPVADDAPESFRDLFRELETLEMILRAHIRVEREDLFPRALELEFLTTD